MALSDGVGWNGDVAAQPAGRWSLAASLPVSVAAVPVSPSGPEQRGGPSRGPSSRRLDRDLRNYDLRRCPV
jgi:hypothetical protein